MKKSLLNIFFFKISFIKIFNFNLNTRVIKLNRLIINSSKLTIILIHFKLQIKMIKMFNRLNLIIKII